LKFVDKTVYTFEYEVKGTDYEPLTM
jgi:hypothetical protein